MQIHTRPCSFLQDPRQVIAIRLGLNFGQALAARERGTKETALYLMNSVCLSSSPMCSSDASVSLVRLNSSVPSMLLALNFSTNPSRPSSTSHADTSSSNQSLTSRFDRPAEVLPERVNQTQTFSQCQQWAPLNNLANFVYARISWNTVD